MVLSRWNFFFLRMDRLKGRKREMVKINYTNNYGKS